MRSLRAKLIAPFIAGTLALTVLLAAYTYSSAKKSMEDAVHLISEAKSDHVAGSMTLLYGTLSSALRNMVADPHVTSLFSEKGDDPLVRAKNIEWLHIVTQGNEYYRDILVLNKSGICIASSNPGHVGNEYRNAPYVRDALGGVFGMGDTSVGKVSKRFSARMAGPVDVAGKVVGALVIQGDFPKIVDYDTRSEYDDHSIFTAMLSPEGLFVAHKNKEIMGNAKKLSPQLYRALAWVGERGDVVTYVMDGKTYMGYAQLEPVSRWLVITSGVQEEVLASAFRMGLAVLGISFAFLCCISFVVIRLANGILTSLLSLIEYARLVSDDNFDLPLGDTERKDELGTLHISLQRLVQTLRSMLLQSQEASKMKGQFLANMSHEIRSPLNAIIGMAHLSLRSGDLTPKQHVYLNNIQVAAKSLLGLINDILDISKIEAGMLELESISFSLHEVLENTIAIHQETAKGRGLTLSMHCEQDVPERLVGDPLRLGQVLNNLVSNGLKFTQEGGVSIYCACDVPKEGAPQCARVRIRVSDTGIGIAPSAQVSLFQPFTQADASITRQFGGTGLGLAISDKLVNMLGGSMLLSSEVGKGTTFGFSILLEYPSSSALTSDEEQSLEQAFARIRLEGKRILVAEDNAVNQFIMKELLEPSGVEVVFANNGQEAVDAVSKESFDLVFMDMQMPVMDGLEATLMIRKAIDKHTLPIIAVTANAMKEDREKGVACGMNDYITKPIEPRHLFEMLQRHLT